ncbi:sigma factor [Streptomyces sp. NBC_01298]|uniref:sigma factor n=1 Tax=Streptomyces sp. NBC_01298 TaxID=2903817 RepID=UPI002E12825B
MIVRERCRAPEAPADAIGPFTAHRRVLFDVACRMLGSLVDAEDVLQDAWLNGDRADRSAVLDPRAYLVRTVTNLSSNRLTSGRARRCGAGGAGGPGPCTGPAAAVRHRAGATGRGGAAVPRGMCGWGAERGDGVARSRGDGLVGRRRPGGRCALPTTWRAGCWGCPPSPRCGR